MNFKFILWLLLMIINHALGEFLQMSLANVNTSIILMRISGITKTACHMECAKQSLCHSIAVTERLSNKLPDCLLLKEDNGFYGAGNEMTTIRTIGYGVKVNGQWGCWRSISACTVSCGGGSVNQTRDCDSPKPTHGGDNCTGPANRTVKCNEQNCPVHGQWGNWRNISACTFTCGGGVLNQSRDCDSPKPEHGGNDCAGPSNRTMKCNEQNCPIHGQWGNWKDSSVCGVTCGGGTLRQTRDCDSPKPENAGDECIGPKIRTVKCNEQNCPILVSTSIEERETKTLVCTSSTQLNIVSAQYGLKYNCGLIDIRSTISQMCNGKVSCSVRPTNDLAGSDPCSRRGKELYLTYECRPR